MRSAAAKLLEWVHAGRTVVHEADSKTLLGEAGVALPRRDPKSGACVVKLCSDKYPHKTEHGLVELNVPAAQIGEVAAVLSARAGDGVLIVEEMIEDGVAEWIVGCRHDATFGPITVIGAGGIFVELINEAKARLAPVDAATASRAIRSQRASKLLMGARGRPKGDIDALIGVVTAVSAFFAEHAGLIHQIEINPVIVRPVGQGAVAADALMVLRSQT
jgi:acetate---CoA ligase (ADP-forming) subunit beta